MASTNESAKVARTVVPCPGHRRRPAVSLPKTRLPGSTATRMSASGPISHESAVLHLRALACTYLHLLEVECSKREPGLVGFPEHGRAVGRVGEPSRRCFARWSSVLGATTAVALAVETKGKTHFLSTRLTSFQRPAGGMPGMRRRSRHETSTPIPTFIRESGRGPKGAFRKYTIPCSYILAPSRNSLFAAFRVV